jgi:glycosyl hydrolase family 39 (putative alpha-L-iduronidase)
VPQWLFRTPARVPYPDDPAAQSWDYLQGTELRDPSRAELVGYFARVAAWYAAGGFVDEAGRAHRSGHHYRFDAWEVLNEPNAEHQMSGAEYVRRYDAIVDAVRRASPGTRFIGPALVFPFYQERFMKTFLKPAHHRPGVPIDMMSYHFYVSTEHERLTAGCPAPAFAEVDRGVSGARRLERLRARLRPAAGTAVTESGTVAVEDLAQWKPGYVYRPIPDTYWRLSAAVWAYMVSRLAELGVDVVAQSALAQFPGQFASVTMLDWESGEPNARYWVLKTLCDAMRGGGTLVQATTGSRTLHARAWRASDGGRRLLLVNTCDAPASVALDVPAGARWTVVEDAHAAPRREALPAGASPVLGGLGVALVELPPG